MLLDIIVTRFGYIIDGPNELRSCILYFSSLLCNKFCSGQKCCLQMLSQHLRMLDWMTARYNDRNPLT